MRAGPPAAVVHSTALIRPGPARGGDRVPMSTHQTATPSAPTRSCWAIRSATTTCPTGRRWPGPTPTPRRCAPSSNSTRLNRRSLAANGEGTAGLSQSLMVLAVTAAGTELRYLSAAGGPPSG